MLVSDKAIADLLICPTCCTGVIPCVEGGWRCPARDCASGGAAFARVGDMSVFVNFADSVLDKATMVDSGAASAVVRHAGLRARLFAAIDGGNPVTPRFSMEILDACRALSARHGGRPRILVVGGGTIGSGADALYAAPDVDLVSFDIYASPHVTMLADAHAIPLIDGSVDGVWIQAVLEHVIDPARVVQEIERVLRPEGLVFADTPFLWPVHEKAYDFTRWTPSGHRWLFRGFDVLSAGSSSGPGTVTLLSLRYLVSSLFRSTKMGQILTFPFAWLRLLDRLCDNRKGLDAAGGLFFYGRKATAPLSAKALIDFYEQQVPLQAAARR